MDVSANRFSQNRSAINALAAVGFVALMALSMWLAVYSTRYIPSFINRVGSAAVYLGSVFIPSPKPSLSVVPALNPTTIYFGEASSTISRVATTSKVAISIPSKPIRTIAGTKTSNAYQIGSTTVATSSVQNGLPDFIVSINAIGYLTTSSAESFVASSTVPSGNRPAIRFTIKNIGKSATGQWHFSASIPTQSAYVYQSQLQQSLNSGGDSIDYTLGFDQANKGAGQTISITANFDNSIAESNTNNNTASTTITILGN